ncbi:hypothetical protein T484DRAFT_2248795 [Baffinella frigidus]|nr:hypothetical protein T484DRAFT_2248795 [Cryptophyta sp. CCMP2293]
MKKAFKRDKPKLFSYPIEDIEGIGEVLGEKLKDAGAHTTKELLAKCASSGHAAFAKEAGLSEGQIRKFAAIADLMQVRGISTEYGELVHLVGIETFTQLPGQDPVALAAKMEELVKSKALVPHAGRMQVRKVPTAKVVANWIDEAQKLAEAQNLVDANLGTGTSSGAEGAVGEGGPNAKWPKT